MIDYKGIELAVEKYAPLLSSVISPFNPIAGSIILEISKALNVKPDQIATTISNDPNTAMALKELEIKHQDILVQNQTEDHANAREREEKVIQLTGKRDLVLDMIAFIVIIGFFVMCAMVEFTHLDQSDHDVLYMLSGQLTAGFMMVLSYYFGSSNKQ